jgi:hypothetical protein
MKRIFVLAVSVFLLSGCAAWNRFINPPKRCTTSCDYYGNCEEKCRPIKPNQTCTTSCDYYGNCEEKCR